MSFPQRWTQQDSDGCSLMCKPTVTQWSNVIGVHKVFNAIVRLERDQLWVHHVCYHSAQIYTQTEVLSLSHNPHGPPYWLPITPHIQRSSKFTITVYDSKLQQNMNGSYDVVYDLTEVTRCVKGGCAERAEESVGHVHYQVVVSCYQLIDSTTWCQLRHIWRQRLTAFTMTSHLYNRTHPLTTAHPVTPPYTVS